MASLLTAIGAGLVVGQGRRIEADQEATRKADEIRAQKLQEFDFAKQLQDAKIAADMKMKEMELGARYKEEDPAKFQNTLDTLFPKTVPGNEKKQADLWALSEHVGNKQALTIGFRDSMTQEKNAAAAELNVKDATGSSLAPDKKWDEKGKSSLVPAKTDPETGNQQTYSASSAEHQEAVFLANKYQNIVARNLRMSDAEGQPTENSRLTNQQLNIIAGKLATADIAIKTGNELAASAALAEVDSFGDSLKISPQEWDTILKDSPSYKIFKEYNAKQQAPTSGSSAGGAVPQEGGEVQGTVMPNEVPKGASGIDLTSPEALQIKADFASGKFGNPRSAEAAATAKARLQSLRK
jgi:hypothetical protein